MKTKKTLNKNRMRYLTCIIAMLIITGALLTSACISMADTSALPQVSPAGHGYNDIKKGSWYYDTVSDMSEKGWLSGYPDRSFRPDTAITGAEFTSVVARIKGLEPSAAAVSSHWAGPLLQTALSAGLYDYDELPPTAETYDLPVSRQVAVSILMRAFAPGASGDYSECAGKMKDLSQLDGRYYNTTFAAYRDGIAIGDSSGCFNPLSGLTRAEASALLLRAADRYGLSGIYSGDSPVIQPDTQGPGPGLPQAGSSGVKGGVSENGQLHVSGSQLCNEKGQPVVLHGMSTHGIHWFPQYADPQSVKATADAGANLFRIAMYTGENGYISDPGIKNRVTACADAAISNDMYVIIDWHILSDGDPRTYKAQAKEFFAQMAERYKDSPAVLYEICNEPNGNISWSSDVRPYAEELIPVIRAIDDDAVILVGTTTWSQDLDKAAADPVRASNIMYTCHFYAGTHTQWLRDRISYAISAGLPVFISEWGTSDASGSGGCYLDEAQKWIDFMDENKLSWANWSLCDKSESSAALVPGASPSGGFSQDELTVSGRFVFARF